MIAAAVLWLTPGGRVGAEEVDGRAVAAAIEQSFVRAIERAEKSVVSIARIRPPTGRDDSERRRGRRFPGRAPQIDTDNPESTDFIPTEFASGIVIDAGKGEAPWWILTNYHVVRGGPVYKQTERKSEFRLHVRFADRLGGDAEIYSADPRSDLALLRLTDAAAARLGRSIERVKPLKLGEPPQFRKGQLILALGNPYAIARDGSASASWGIISNIGRRPAPPEAPSLDDYRRDERIHHFGTLLHVDCRLNLGTSGGALLNLDGELIGMTTALAALEGYEKSVGYAIPFDAATRRILQSLALGREVEYGFLGITLRDAQLADRAGRFGRETAALVGEVSANSPAVEGGLRPHDVILEVNGRPVRDRYDLMRLIGLAGAGNVVRLRVWRETTSSELHLSLRLGKWPVVDDEGIIAPNPRHRSWRGISVDYPTGRDRFVQTRPLRYHAAVLVTDVSEQRTDADAGLQPGQFISHVNGTPVQTPEQFHRAVANLDGAARLRLVDGSEIRWR